MFRIIYNSSIIESLTRIVYCENNELLDKNKLLKNNIKTEIHYPVAPNKQKCMEGILDDQPTPIAEKIHQTTLSLPISYFHTESAISRVIEVMNQF